MDHNSGGAVQHGSKNKISESQTSERGDETARQYFNSHLDRRGDRTRLNQNSFSYKNYKFSVIAWHDNKNSFSNTRLTRERFKEQTFLKHSLG